jgi:NADH-quinone oxidoreductase subunit J
MVIVLFVIMLVNVVVEEEGRAPIFNRPPQVIASLVFLSLLAGVLVIYAIPYGYKGLTKRDNAQLQQAAGAQDAREQSLQTGATGVSRVTKETERVGTSLYTYASLPFEIASLLLLVAIIGSVMLARTLKQEAAVDDVDPEMLAQAPSAEVGTDNI